MSLNYLSKRPRGLLAPSVVSVFLFTLGGCASIPLHNHAAALVAPKLVGTESEPHTTCTCPGYASMVRIPEGQFRMGAMHGFTNIDERPEHIVALSDYWIDQHEVTVAEYRSCVEAHVCNPQDVTHESFMGRMQGPDSLCNYLQEDRNDHPMNCVSWDDANTYCHYVGKRLPTEAEWEKAARGESGNSMFPWGDIVPGADDSKRANLADETAKTVYPALSVFSGYRDGYAGTAPVGSFPGGVSSFGVHDMVGNVLEWISDYYNATQYLELDISDPKGPVYGGYKVARGGAWDSDPVVVRTTRRWSLLKSDRFHSLGFRCAADPQVNTQTGEE